MLNKVISVVDINIVNTDIAIFVNSIEKSFVI